MNSTEYKHKAWEVAVLSAARSLVEERYLNGGGGQKEELICEEVSFRDRVVPPEAIANVLRRLQAEEHRIIDEMNQYELRKKDDVKPLPQVPQEEPRKEGSRDAGAKPGVKNRRS